MAEKRKAAAQEAPSIERTLVIVKPDGVERHLVGEVIRRMENTGLKIEAMKMVTASRELMDRHYAGGLEWCKGVGEKTKKNYAQYGLDIVKELGTDDDTKIGKMVKEWLIDYISAGPSVAMILSGNHAVDNVRRVCGPTLPLVAPPGSIRGDFALDSADYANRDKRAVKNIVHASGNLEEAKAEIALWFPEFRQ